MSDWIAHYGIKGQKRGVRRWQYANGTINKEGRIRYGLTPANMPFKRYGPYKPTEKISEEEFNKLRPYDKNRYVKDWIQRDNRRGQDDGDNRLLGILVKNTLKSIGSMDAYIAYTHSIEVFE